MSYLYVTEQGATISVEGNYVRVSIKEGQSRKVPIETLESISIFGHSQRTMQCTVECLQRGIPVAYYSRFGKYYGYLQSTGHIRADRQRQQAFLYKTDFSVELAKRIIKAKIHNQEVLVRRYQRNNPCELNDELKQISLSAGKIANCITIEQIMGYEGTAARNYFQCLSKLVEPEFAFRGRSRRPPRDEFNAMLSLGYSIVMNEFYGKIVNRGLNPYFGFVHRDHEKHPTLASDLMEEWRAVIVDSVVMSLVNGREIGTEHFIHDLDEPGYFLNREGMKIFISKLQKKLDTEMRYLNYIEYAVGFRRAMDLQIGELIKAIEVGDASLYEPIWIR